jgi:hypothetical protein
MLENADRVVDVGSAKTTVYKSRDGHDEKGSGCVEEGREVEDGEGKGKQKLSNLRGKTSFHNQSH